MTDLGQILTGLVQRTTEGKLKWSRSAQSDRYVTSVDAISVLIVEYIDIGIGVAHRLDILDESGETVESLGAPDTTPEENQKLDRLFVLARRSAHNIDSTLEKLA